MNFKSKYLIKFGANKNISLDFPWNRSIFFINIFKFNRSENFNQMTHSNWTIKFYIDPVISNITKEIYG